MTISSNLMRETMQALHREGRRLFAVVPALVEPVSGLVQLYTIYYA